MYVYHIISEIFFFSILLILFYVSKEAKGFTWKLWILWVFGDHQNISPYYYKKNSRTL